MQRVRKISGFLFQWMDIRGSFEHVQDNDLTGRMNCVYFLPLVMCLRLTISRVVLALIDFRFTLCRQWFNCYIMQLWRQLSLKPIVVWWVNWVTSDSQPEFLTFYDTYINVGFLFCACQTNKFDFLFQARGEALIFRSWFKTPYGTRKSKVSKTVEPCKDFYGQSIHADNLTSTQVIRP